MTLPVTFADIQRALPAVRAAFPETPTTFSPSISELIGHDVYLKWESKLKTGSFKERGAVSFLSSLDPKIKETGVCAASAGNHALALSFHAAKVGIPCTIVMPTSAPLVKIKATEMTGASVLLHGATFDEAYTYAEALARERNLTYVPAFDHERIVAGQGTAGIEILAQCPHVDSVVVPVGGGGLSSGIAIAVKHAKPDAYLVGAQSEWAVRAQQHGPLHPILSTPSIADGIAVKRPGKITRPILDALMDRMVVSSEQEIAKSIIKFLELERALVEGGGAVGLAALLQGTLPKKCRCTVVVVSGGNIDMNVLSRLIQREMGERGRILKLNVSAPDRPGSLYTVTGILASLGANVLEVYHDRSCSRIPGNVEMIFLLEVRDFAHKQLILGNLAQSGVPVREV